MDFNKIKAMGLEYAEKGKNAALDLAEKGKTQALIFSEQGKLLKAQRQLGALVYSLAKGKEENQPLVDKYIEMIDTIEAEIARLKATLTPAEAAEVEFTEPVEEEPAAAGAAARRQHAVRVLWQPHLTGEKCEKSVSKWARICKKCGPFVAKLRPVRYNENSIHGTLVRSTPQACCFAKRGLRRSQ